MNAATRTKTRASARRAQLRAAGLFLRQHGYDTLTSMAFEHRPLWALPRELARRALIPEIDEIYAGSIFAAAQHRRLCDDNPHLFALFSLFLQGESLPRAQIEGLFLSSQVETLEKSGLATWEADALVANWRINPLGGGLFCSDVSHKSGGKVTLDYVQFGQDTAILAGAMARVARRAERGLDLCTGSGAMAVLMSRFLDAAEGVDINPRAIDVAHCNAHLSGVENASFTQASMYDACRGRYDLIVSNPPFVLMPPKLASVNRVGHGGDNGIEHTMEVLAGLDAFLTDRGQAIILTQGVRDAKGRCWLVEATRRLAPVNLKFDFEEIMSAFPSAYADYYLDRGVTSTPSYLIRVERHRGFQMTVRRRGPQSVQRLVGGAAALKRRVLELKRLAR